jgi:hypothetical protein
LFTATALKWYYNENDVGLCKDWHFIGQALVEAFLFADYETINAFRRPVMHKTL